ncbi:stage 0 sporulation regulatory protein [Mesobacillus persicus]|uniref:Stage 0 sporulation regulatory protein n=1 Tax=Mesobacillus persicus TaxID=930146 RepID=A0A1H7YV94_9BACI|nr:aspartyl-phosphate phosphatase Spo0E family protein [Mesobacillus persicus]SEM50136.1 stage 0 sporulation regulatory protein [Mesobacillus persicus]
MSKNELVRLIEKKRSELIEVATTNGLTSSVAIRYSQELDHLINTYQQQYTQPSKTY